MVLLLRVPTTSDSSDSGPFFTLTCVSVTLPSVLSTNWQEVGICVWNTCTEEIHNPHGLSLPLHEVH